MTLIFNGGLIETGSRETTVILLTQMKAAVEKWHKDGCPKSGDHA